MLAGPDGAQVTLAHGPVSPGVHTLMWNGTSGSTPTAEGSWTLAIRGTDDRDLTTRAERAFSLDDTLSSLAVAIGRHGRPTATFLLGRWARLRVQVQRRNGVPVATPRSGRRAAGAEWLTWHGRIGRRRAPGGRYQVAVQATSSVGRSSLVAPFSYRSHSRH